MRPHLELVSKPRRRRRWPRSWLRGIFALSMMASTMTSAYSAVVGGQPARAVAAVALAWVFGYGIGERKR